MKTLQEAWTLIKFEHKMTPPSYGAALMMLALGTFLAVTTMDGADNQATMGTEVLFFTIVVAFPYAIRSEHMRAKNIGNKEHVSPIVVLLYSMPIRTQAIATYRMLSYVGMTVLFNSVFFTFVYVLSPYIRSIAPLQTYIIFVFMWVCLAIYVGGIQVNIEAGYHRLTYWFSTLLIWLPLSMIGVLLLFYQVYTEGLIQWMLMVSTYHPFLGIGISMTLAIAGYVFHRRGLLRRMEKTDY